MVTFFSSVVSPVFTAITLVVSVFGDSTLTRPLSLLSQRIDSPAAAKPASSSSVLVPSVDSDTTLAVSSPLVALHQVNTRRRYRDGIGWIRRISRSHRRREHCPQQNTGKEEGKHPCPTFFSRKSLLCSLESRGLAGSARPLLSNMIRGYVVGESPQSHLA